MKYLATIQTEFLKEAVQWDNLSLEEQQNYLKRHPKSKRHITARPKLQNVQLNENDYGYHVTSLDRLNGIKSKGMIPTNSGDFGYDYADRNYFGNEPNESWYYVSQKFHQLKDKPKPILLRVKKQDLQDANNIQAREFFVNRIVPPDHIEIFQNGKWIPIKESENKFTDFSDFLRGMDKKVFDDFYKNSEQTKSIKNYTTELGTIDYYQIPKNERYEFDEEDSDFWKKADNWIALDLIKVNKQKQGFGKLLLNDWLKKFPKGTGIVLNATPVDSNMDQQKLQNWYKSIGFQQISTTNISLYKIL